MRRIFYFNTVLLFAMVLIGFSVKSDGQMLADGNNHPPASSLNIDSVSLLLSWQKPVIVDTAFFDDFASGSFVTHGWTFDVPHWTINMSEGNPEPAASFMSQQLQYFQSAMLTSPETEASGNTCLLSYEIFFNADTVTSYDQMYIQVLDGAQWKTVRQYHASEGSIDWTSKSIDITNFIQPETKIRFRGNRGFDLNQNAYWLIDNVSLLNIFDELPVTAYQIYLQNEFIGTTSGTFFEIPPQNLTYGQTYVAGVEAVYEGGVSLREELAFTSAYLDPPQNLQGVSVVQEVTLTWENPELHANNITGFKLYRNNALIDSVGANTFTFSETNQMPGIHQYAVTAVYDLTPYGFSGYGESLPCGAVHVSVNNFGKPVPYFEDWDDASFALAEWTKGGSNPDNWKITTMAGNPVPAAEFAWNPPLADYEAWIISPAINAYMFNCAETYLEFDIKLEDNHANEKEELLVQVYKYGYWLTMKKFKNAGSFDWETQKIKIYSGAGQTLYIRFLAKGENSTGIYRWIIDNIHIDGQCRPPRNLIARIIGSPNIIKLEWEEPDCTSIPFGELMKLWQWSGSPTNAYYQHYNRGFGVVYDLSDFPDAILESIDFHQASWGVYGNWDYKIHIVDWITHELIETLGPFQTTGNDKWENGVELGKILGFGGGLIGVILEPLGHLPTNAYPCLSADNELNGLSLKGEVPNWSAFSSSSVGDFLMNLWIRTPNATSSDKIKLPPVNHIDQKEQSLRNSVTSSEHTIAQQLMILPDLGTQTVMNDIPTYNLYRSLNFGSDYELITPEPVKGYIYIDSTISFGRSFYAYYLATTIYRCYESVFSNEAATPISSPIGFDEVTFSSLKVSPVPATNKITVAYGDPLSHLQLFDYLGKIVIEKTGISCLTSVLDTSTLPPGIYVLRVYDEKGQAFSRKVIISR